MENILELRRLAALCQRIRRGIASVELNPRQILAPAKFGQAHLSLALSEVITFACGFALLIFFLFSRLQYT